MSLRNLNKEELNDVAEFFAVEVEAADDEKGPTKKEYLAALAGEDEPVTWEDYNDIYLPAKASKQTKVDDGAPELTKVPEPESVKAEPVDDSDYVLIKMERLNHTYQVRGFTFHKDHPFQRVPEDVADYLVRSHKGFRLAMPKEVSDFYN